MDSILVDKMDQFLLFSGLIVIRQVRGQSLNTDVADKLGSFQVVDI